MDHQLIAEAGAQAGAAGAAGMDPDTFIKAMSRVGAGIAAVGVFGPGIGIGIAASKALEGMARQPEMEASLRNNGIIFAALMEALGLFAFVVAILLYMFPLGL